MIYHLRNAAAILTIGCLAALLFNYAAIWLLIACGMANLWLVGGQRFLPASISAIYPNANLAFNTLLACYGVLMGGDAAWAVGAVVTALFAWNATLFSKRCPTAPPAVQRGFLKWIGGVTIFALVSCFSSLGLQGNLALNIWEGTLLILIAGILLLKIIATATKN